MGRVWKVKSLSRSIKGHGTPCTTRCCPSGQELTHEHNKSVGFGCVISQAWRMAHRLVSYMFPAFLFFFLSHFSLWKSCLPPEALEWNSRREKSPRTKAASRSGPFVSVYDVRHMDVHPDPYSASPFSQFSFHDQLLNLSTFLRRPEAMWLVEHLKWDNVFQARSLEEITSTSHL